MHTITLGRCEFATAGKLQKENKKHVNTLQQTLCDQLHPAEICSGIEDAMSDEVFPPGNSDRQDSSETVQERNPYIEIPRI
jgi:hypothetical protein